MNEFDKGLENCINRLNNNRTYEEKYHVKPLENFKIVADFGDIKFLTRLQSQNGYTFAFIFKTGNSDLWLACIPTINQIEVLANELNKWFDRNYNFKEKE